MTRTTLARASGVSERYLALLEIGSANVLNLVLHRIADAMDLLLRDSSSERELRLEAVCLFDRISDIILQDVVT